ncbi:MAG: flagellar filament capping protein FliD [Holosporaceae bacterium]
MLPEASSFKAPSLKDPTAKLKPLDLFQPEDLKLPESLEKELGMDAVQKSKQLNLAYEARFQKHETSVGKYVDQFQKLQELQAAFGEAKDYMQRLTDSTLWDKYSVRLPEDKQAYVEAFSSGPPCAFHLSVERLAINKISVKTTNFQSPGRSEAADLPEGTLFIGEKTFNVTQNLSLKNLFETINSACAESLKIDVIEIRPGSENAQGCYRLAVSVLDETKPFVRDDCGGDLLRALGFETKTRGDCVFAKVTRAQRDAKFTVNDIKMRRPSNQVEEVFEGMRFTLKKKTPPNIKIPVEVTFEKNVIKALLLGFAKSLTQYQELLQKHAPLGGQEPSSLIRFSFLRTFFNDFQLLCAELQDDRTQSMFGLKKMAGVYVMDEDSFTQASQNSQQMKEIFIGEPQEDDHKAGRIKTFFQDLGRLETSFKEALQSLERTIGTHHQDVAEIQKRIDAKKASMRKGLPKLQAAAMQADLLKKLNEQMLQAQFGISSKEN